MDIFSLHLRLEGLEFCADSMLKNIQHLIRNHFRIIWDIAKQNLMCHMTNP
uniref:Uncharacterized protein n=1 Tax=Arundo donax TaxID=35708 RepID=A0A0A8ZTV5_ARUDO